jgi:hypothetical protein
MNQLLVCLAAVTRPEARAGISSGMTPWQTVDEQHALAVCVLAADHRPRHDVVAACRPPKPYRPCHFVGRHGAGQLVWR